MGEIGKGPSADFAGFLDGFEARNMAKIERNAAVPLSELQTRLRALQTALKADPNAGGLRTALAAAEDTMRDPSRTIIERLGVLGRIVQDAMVTYEFPLLSNPTFTEQLKWIVKRYIEAAGISQHPSLIDAAVKLGEGYTAATAPAHS